MINRFGLLAAGALLLCAGVAQAQYAKKGVRLLKETLLSSMPTAPTAGAGCTGWTSPNGREYAIMGVRNGTVIYDVTNPSSPVAKAHIPGPTSTWHENATMNGYGYFVTDGSGSVGMQIVDLRFLDSLGTATLVSTYTGNGLSNVHTIQANPQSNTLFLNGSNRNFAFLDATNPTAPVEVGRWTTRYVHDSYTTNYTDGPWAGREISFACCGANGVYILDVTNKATPTLLGFIRYLVPNAYCHSGSLTPDKKYFLVNDELDEQNGVVTKCTTHIIDVQDLANPIYVGTFSNNQTFIDHNSRMRGNYLLLAAYRGGLRIYDASNPLAMTESGFFDTYTGADAFQFNGAWGTYIFPSGTTIIADINKGLFTVDPSEALGQGAVPMSFGTVRGTFVSGTLLNVRLSDDSYMVWEGIPAAGSRDLTGIANTVTFETTNMPSSSLDVTLEGKLSNLGAADAHLFLKNVSSGQWVRVGAWTFSTIDNTFKVLNLPTSSYVDGTGKIEARIEFFPIVRTTSSVFRAHIDTVKIDVHN